MLRPERDLRDVLAVVTRWAAQDGAELVATEDDERLPAEVRRVAAAELPAACDLVMALGGDGTMLSALRVAAPHGIPALGVNLGRLGFLTEVDQGHLAGALAAVARGEYVLEDRTALALAPVGATEVGRQVAYNDLVLSRMPGRGQAALGLSVDGDLLVRYSSDGVIVATAMGSTAYSFAAGGPIVSPRAHGMVVTPDAAHGLFSRAVVLAPDERLGVEVLPTSAPLALEVDGRLAGRVEAGALLEVTSAPASARVVRLGPDGFARRARRKLGITNPAGLADFDLAGHRR